MDYPQIRKLSLKVFIGFLAITALIAIVALLSGSSNPVTGKILVTCLSISGASICSMSCAAYLEKRKKPAALGFTGIVLSILAAVLIVVGVWSDIQYEPYWKGTGNVIVIAIAFAHAFLLWIPQLDLRHRWIQPVSSITIGVLSIQIIFSIWSEVENELYLRFLAVVAILAALETLVIPILMKLRKETPAKGTTLTLEHVEGDLYRDADGKEYTVMERINEISEMKDNYDFSQSKKNPYTEN